MNYSVSFKTTTTSKPEEQTEFIRDIRARFQLKGEGQVLNNQPLVYVVTGLDEANAETIAEFLREQKIVEASSVKLNQT